MAAKVYRIDGHYLFECPGCKAGHSFGPGWAFNGDMEKPTFTPSLVSFIDGRAAPEGRICHLHLQDGVLKFLGDCWHELRGRDVPCPDWEE